MGEKQGDKPVPRDLQDQQAGPGKDRWDAAEGPDKDPGADIPDTDEAGTGPRGAPRSGAVHPEDPLPDEPSA
ncbi:hypothetical protein ABZ357_39355 [Streptomyces sp. NPDC005917]|uniref:hypothetical protein n=1 Tax=unclassified Streptomyces TaxID=2593676 RepID=UPI0033FED3F3